MKTLIPDSERAIVCRCGSVSFALRGDGFCECHGCGKVGLYQWDRFSIETESKQSSLYDIAEAGGDIYFQG